MDMGRLRRSAGLGAALLVALSRVASAARAPYDKIDVRVERRAGKAYEVQGLFFVPASSGVVWSVLGDYERIPEFVSSMRESRVVETRADGTLLVAQQAVGGTFLLTKKVHVLLEVSRASDRIVFVDRARKDFDEYDGRWQTQESPGGTLVLYNLRARPSFPAPAFLMRGAMRRGARELLDQVRGEILRRARAAARRLQTAER